MEPKTARQLLDPSVAFKRLSQQVYATGQALGCCWVIPPGFKTQRGCFFLSISNFF
jgi:hypothetical protein